MDSLFIAIPLSKIVKNQLERLCFGLPYVKWTEHADFHLDLLSLGSFDGAVQLDIQEVLSNFHIAPFSLSLQGLGCFRAKKANGVIWAGVAPSEDLTALIKNLTEELNTVVPNFKPFTPHVALGRFTHLDEKRLLDYLESNSFFETEPFFNDSITLMKSQVTPDHRILYQELDHFKLTPPINKLHVIQ